MEGSARCAETFVCEWLLVALHRPASAHHQCSAVLSGSQEPGCPPKVLNHILMPAEVRLCKPTCSG